MATSDIAICAGALVRLGARPIQSLTEDNARAIACAQIYPSLKRAILSVNAWRFATKKKDLTRDGVTPAGEWAYAFLIPGEAIRDPSAIFDGPSSKQALHDYEIFERKVLCNAPAIVADITTEVAESTFPAFFERLMISAMCAELALPITDQQSIADRWVLATYGSPSEGGLGGLVGQSMALDAQSSGNIGLNADAFLDARMGGL